MTESTIIETDDGEFHVQTYELSVPHGPDRDMNYETYVTGPKADSVMTRYQNEVEADNGHEDICETIRNGDYRFEPVAYRLVVGDYNDW